ncbi:TPA: Zn-dependent hydrolase [Escherichia coli]|nr:Zn-dependent hydrolase [Escherichia coli]MED9234084.1 Zn-dependent hydrolase [Escherichia coli]MED9293520.1 Zn-dependent hydrolase [Escherichia coli]HAX9857506.1 Zn-dependent hydrolase [Escherichia coli]HAX9867164.1 Zn-dependent hydrolase [Escherichia coli]
MQLQTELNLDGKLLIAQLNELGKIGADPVNGGRTRAALTDDDKQGRDLLVKWMRELDLDVKVDKVGNIFGTLLSADDSSDKKPLMLGSHIDTVVNAGALDGCYGVLSGLAVVRAFRKAGIKPARPITVGAFTNEEGIRYQPDMMGSLVYAGGLSVEDTLNTIGTDGTRLGDELKRIGYAGELEPGSIIPHEYIELHIEQGPILEAEGIQIGAVENLQGISWQEITIKGTANHAGTTPTRLRNDAGFAAASVIAFLRKVAGNGTTLATIGSMRFEPNVINVIPRLAKFTVDLRDPDEARLKDAENKLKEFLAEISEKEGVEISTERLVRFEPVLFNQDIVSQIIDSAEKFGLSWRRMTSGAGHDAQMIARIAPAAMIFVPSKNGISHNPAEYTSEEELIQGARLLLDVVSNRLKK